MEHGHSQRAVATTAGAPLWRPLPEQVERAALTRYASWVQQRHDLDFGGDYHQLWRWSVERLDDFWASIWDYFGVGGSYEHVLGRRDMPGTEWFPGAHLSYSREVFRGKRDADVAIVHESETRPGGTLTWGELRTQTAAIAAGLRAIGVGRGDRVAAYLPNVPETVAAFLATSSLGAIWTSAAPEFGSRSVIDRFAQVTPKVLLAADGYRFNGQDFDRREACAAIAAGVGGRLVFFGFLDGSGWEPGFLAPEADELEFTPVPFDHPLWILFSSGTTGLPKAIVQSHGGILLEQLKTSNLHFDIQAGDRMLWVTTTGWAMWNILLGVLLTPGALVLYDGSPRYPGAGVLWDLVARTGVTAFGASAGYFAMCAQAGLLPAEGRDLGALRAIGSTGSPLAPESFDWIYEQLPDVWLYSMSGGTDVCTAFVGGVPTLPVHRGEIQARALGCDVQAFDDAGRPLAGGVGELVITAPMPSMPTAFWNDPDDVRLRESYFDTYPGVWRHGDWIELTDRGTAVITGRSDATINRGGIRMGTSELYRVVLAEPEVVDALVVDVPQPDGSLMMPLFVVLRDGDELDDELIARLRTRLRTDCSPRHVPDTIVQIAEVPRTHSGKPLEIPVKRILMGEAVDAVVSRDSLANPQALDEFVGVTGRLVV